MSGDKEPNNLSLDRAGFVVALSAALLALLPFKDDAEKVFVYLFGLTLSLYQLSAVFLGTLIISAYFSGLNQIRFGIPWLLRFRWLRLFEWASQGLYVFAFVMPLIVAIGWGLSLLLQLLPPHFVEYAKLAASLAQTISTVIAAIISFSTLSWLKRGASETLDDARTGITIRQDSSYSEGDYRVFILQLFQSVISALEVLLVQRLGLPARRLPARVTVQTAHQLELIDNKEVAAINDLRTVRNRIAHDVGTEKITKAQADTYRELVGPILNRLEQLREKSTGE